MHAGDGGCTMCLYSPGQTNTIFTDQRTLTHQKLPLIVPVEVMFLALEPVILM